MKYITITAKNYDDAVKKARNQYGEAIRIHSRKDVAARGGFLWLAKRTYVELTCYLSDAPVGIGLKEVVRSRSAQAPPLEAPTIEERVAAPPEPNADPIIEPITQTSAETSAKPVAEEVEDATGIQSPVAEVEVEKPSPLMLVQPAVYKARSILQLNDFSLDFIDTVLHMISEELMALLPDIPTDQEFELMLVDKIVSLVEIDHQSQLHPPRIFVLLGPTGVGKTTTIAKVAALYGLQQMEEYRRKVRIITIDSFRIGAYEQISSFGSALGIPVHKVSTESEFFQAIQPTGESELILIDTIGKSPRDSELAVKMKTLLSVPKRDETKFYLAVSGTMKAQDIKKSLEQYASYGITSMIVTKTDETDSIGNILSLCKEQHLPLLFLTDGQKVPKDIHKASASSLLTMLNGFSLDFSNLWSNQLDVDGFPNVWGDTVTESGALPEAKEPDSTN